MESCFLSFKKDERYWGFGHLLFHVYSLLVHRIFCLFWTCLIRNIFMTKRYRYESNRKIYNLSQMEKFKSNTSKTTKTTWSWKVTARILIKKQKSKKYQSFIIAMNLKKGNQALKKRRKKNNIRWDWQWRHAKNLNPDLSEFVCCRDAKTDGEDIIDINISVEKLW